jgi:hypothetical protein
VHELDTSYSLDYSIVEVYLAFTRR